MTRRRTPPPLTRDQLLDLSRIVGDGQIIARGLDRRLRDAFHRQDVETARWLQKRLVAIERAAQERALAHEKAARSDERV